MIAETKEQVLEFINANSLLAYDVETTGLNPRKDRIVGFGISNEGSGIYIPVSIYDLPSNSLRPYSLSHQDILEILQAISKKRLLMFNASFDARFTKYNFGIDLVPALDTDVLLLKHTCDEEFPFGLKEIASKLFGHDVKREKEEMLTSVKVNKGKPTEFYKADYKILGKYCIQDCLLTYKVYNHYKTELTPELKKFFYEIEVMPLYKEVTIPMEETGIQLNIRLIEDTRHEINLDISKLEYMIQEAIKPYLQLFRTWFLNKDYPLQTFKGKVPAWRKKYETQYDAWAAENSGYMFNLLSKHHLKKLFFDTLKETPLSKTPTGQPQVNEDFIESVSNKYEWCKLLIQYNKLVKIKGTYIDRLLDESEDGRFYPSFMQHRTVSGRYGSDIQQLPRPTESTELSAKYTNRIREFIVPSMGNKLISADFEQLEPSVFAHLSRDPALINIFQKGLDFYSDVAINVERLQNVSSVKTASNYLGKLNSKKRQNSKKYGLGIAYGMTGYKLQFELSIPKEDADLLVQQYWSAFPMLANWANSSKEHAKYHGYISTESGRVRHLPDATILFKKYGSRIEDSLGLWKDYNAYPELYTKAKDDYKKFKNIMNNAINFQVQGFGASIINQAMIQINRKFKLFGFQAKFIAQIHDEVVLDCPEAELSQICSIAKQTMENNIKLRVPLRTTPQIGSNFRECK